MEVESKNTRVYPFAILFVSCFSSFCLTNWKERIEKESRDFPTENPSKSFGNNWGRNGAFVPFPFLCHGYSPVLEIIVAFALSIFQRLIQRNWIERKSKKRKEKKRKTIKMFSCLCASVRMEVGGCNKYRLLGKSIKFSSIFRSCVLYLSLKRSKFYDTLTMPIDLLFC